MGALSFRETDASRHSPLETGIFSQPISGAAPSGTWPHPPL